MRQTLDRILDKTAGLLRRGSGALRTGSDALKTLAYLLDPEGHPEPAESPPEGNEEGSFPPHPFDGSSPVFVPPEAEGMIAKPDPRPAPSGTPSPLKGSLLFRSLPKDEFDRLPRPSPEEIQAAIDRGRPDR